MEKINIELPDDIANKLKKVSKKIGVKPEDFMIVSLQEKLASLDPDFAEAMKHVLKKNAELYRRLS